LSGGVLRIPFYSTIANAATTNSALLHESDISQPNLKPIDQKRGIHYGLFLRIAKVATL
jgi:hypothetical protein